MIPFVFRCLVLRDENKTKAVFFFFLQPNHTAGRKRVENAGKFRPVRVLKLLIVTAL